MFRWLKPILKLNLFLWLFIFIFSTINATLTHCAIIEQCPGSSVLTIRQQTENYEVSLILYYTSWSEESVEARNIINDVAHYYSDYVHFATIDCWHLACNCSRTYNTPIGSGSPHKWPTLMLYYGSKRHIQLEYHGEWSFTALSRYINNALKPLERIHSIIELMNISKEADAVVMGIFKSPPSYKYKQYTVAALKWLETDPLRSYRFTVSFNQTILNELRNVQRKTLPFLAYANGDVNSIKVFNINEQLIFNATNIVKWLQYELKGAKRALHGYSTPISLAVKLKYGPVLAVFPNNRNFYQLMETVMDNKGNKKWSHLVNVCKTIHNNNHNKINEIKKSLKNQLKVFEGLLNQQNNVCYLLYDYVQPWYLKYYYEMNKFLKDLYQKMAQHSGAALMQSLKLNMQMLYEQMKCLESYDYNMPPLRIAISQYIQHNINHWQQHAKHNRSVSVVIMDKNKYPDYLESLDIPINTHNLATVFLVDNEKESIYVMAEMFSVNTLREFLQNFFHNNLNPYHRSAFISQQQSLKRLNSENYLRLRELNRFMFFNQLHQYNVTTVALLYNPSCALCANLQHTFLQLAVILRQQQQYIRFVRINVQTNDLPWQFVMTAYPALLVFSKESYSDSRLFPTYLQPNLRNVLAFILAQMPAVDKLKLTVAICESNALPLSQESCWQFVNNLIMQHIGQYLHYWQMFEMERNVIFKRLSAFKDLSLDIQRNLRLL